MIRDMPVFGIQGGKGSFNHAALLEYVQIKAIPKHRVEYLYTTRNVLQSLYGDSRGRPDFGIFAIHNTIAGVVWESIEAMAEFNFEIVFKLRLKIVHCLLKRKDVKRKEIKVVRGHPQAFKQCEDSLRRLDLALEYGEGEMVDPSKIASAVVTGELSPYTAVLGPGDLARYFDDLEVIETGLQDQEDNFTIFLVVKKRGEE